MNLITTITGNTQGLIRSETEPTGYATDDEGSYVPPPYVAPTPPPSSTGSAPSPPSSTGGSTTPLLTKAPHVDALIQDEMAFGYRPTMGDFKLFVYKHKAPFFV